jgi:hypothetical protein
VAFRRRATEMVLNSPAAAEVLASGLRNMLRVVYSPMPDTVARLDTSRTPWVLQLDPESPAEDHCWAMLEVLGVLAHGADATRCATPATRLRLIHD